MSAERPDGPAFSPIPVNHHFTASCAPAPSRWRRFRLILRRARREHSGWLIVLTCVPSLVILYRLIVVFASRMRYPLALEWCEEGQLLQAYRLLHGMDLYVTPNFGFMPDSYPPGYFVVLAAFGAIFGLDYGESRAVSCAAMGLVMFLLAREVYRQFRSVGFPLVWAVLALGFMAAVFPLTTGWFDLVRNDSVVHAMIIGSAVSIHGCDRMSRKRFFASAGLMTFSMFVKQTAVFYVVWILLFEIFRFPRRTLRLGLTVAGFSILTAAFLVWATDGLYVYYTFEVFAHQQVLSGRYMDALRVWLSFAPYLPMLGVGLAVVLWFDLPWRRVLFWSGMLAVAFPASLLPYAKQGGAQNNLLSVALFSGPVGLMVTGSLLSRIRRGTMTAKALAMVCASTAAFYLDARTFATSGYEVPNERWAAAQALKKEYMRLGNDILDLHHPFFAIQAGARTDQLHEMPWADAWLSDVPNLSFRPFLFLSRAEYVVVSGMEIPAVFDALAEYYELDHAFPPGEECPPVTGFPSWPRYLLRRHHPSPTRSCLFEFEGDGDGYDGWEIAGDAFTRPAGRWLNDRTTAIGIEGRGMASSAPSLKDQPTGVLSSPKFEIKRPRLSLLVGGSDHAKVAVELLVEGQSVYVARGQGFNALARTSWDTSAYRGKTARVRITDADHAGHIFVDSICEDEAAPSFYSR
jgi:hypothetical protein